MQARSWQTRPVSKNDIDGIRTLFAAAFGHQRPLRHDAWKFFEAPSGPIIGVVATEGSRIVGFYALLPSPLRTGAEVILGAQSLDTMTHPGFRGQGMFVSLAQACIDRAIEQGVEALYGFPNPSSYPGFVRRLNWDHCGNIHRWIRPLTGAAWPRLPAIAQSLAGIAVRALPDGPHQPENIELVPDAPAPGDLERIQSPSDNVSRVEWTPAWIRWRFAPDSMREYRWICARRKGATSAVVVWGRRSEREATLSAILGNDEASLRACIAAAIRAARRAGMSKMITATNAPTATHILRRFGFIRQGVLPLIVRSMTGRTLGSNIHDFSTWTVQPADLDTL